MNFNNNRNKRNNKVVEGNDVLSKVAKIFDLIYHVAFGAVFVGVGVFGVILINTQESEQKGSIIFTGGAALFAIVGSAIIFSSIKKFVKPKSDDFIENLKKEAELEDTLPVPAHLDPNPPMLQQPTYIPPNSQNSDF